VTLLGQMITWGRVALQTVGRSSVETFYALANASTEEEVRDASGGGCRGIERHDGDHLMRYAKQEARPERRDG